MLRNTFVHVPGIGRKKEAFLWQRGITTWEHLLNNGTAFQPSFPGLAPSKGPASQISEFVRRSQQALAARDVSFFGQFLPQAEQWRMLPDFRSSIVYLDIETTGLSRIYHDITLVGVYDGSKYRTFVRGHNLDRIVDVLSDYSILVTFNGTQFDIPFLRSKFPNIKLPPVHIDLRYVLARLGHRGGLKSIERELGYDRPTQGTAHDGREAVELWYSYVHGNLDSLKRLVRYNFDDTMNLAPIAQYAFHGMRESLCPSRDEFLGTFNVVNKRGQAEASLKGISDRLSPFKPSSQGTTLSELVVRASNGAQPTIVGIDLSGSEARPTGWALLKGSLADTRCLRTDEEIIRMTVDAAPDLVSIDSPLSLPPGTITKGDREIMSCERIHRDSELELKRRGVSVFWCLLPTMQGLTLRGMRLAKRLRAEGLKVIESFPGAAQDILSLPRKRKSVTELAKGLAAFGVKGDFVGGVSDHELDAIMSAIVGYFYLTGQYEALGDSEENDLIIPTRPDPLSRQEQARLSVV